MHINQWINENIINFEKSLDLFENKLLSKKDIGEKDREVINRLQDIRKNVLEKVPRTIPTVPLLKSQMKELSSLSSTLVKTQLIFIQSLNREFDIIFILHYLESYKDTSKIPLEDQNKIIHFLSNVHIEYLSDEKKGGKLLLYCCMHKDCAKSSFIKQIVLLLLDRGVKPEYNYECGCSPLSYLIFQKPAPKELILRIYKANPHVMVEIKKNHQHPLELIFTRLKAFEIVPVLEALIDGGLSLNCEWRDKILWVEILNWLCSYNVFQTLVPSIKNCLQIDRNKLQDKCEELFRLAKGVNHLLLLETVIKLELKLTHVKFDSYLTDWVCKQIAKFDEFSLQTILFIEQLIDLKQLRFLNNDFSSLLVRIMIIPQAEIRIPLIDKIKKKYECTDELLNLIKNSLFVYGRTTSERIEIFEMTLKRLEEILKNNLKDYSEDVMGILFQYKNTLKNLH